jgi:hypothetical protein
MTHSARSLFWPIIGAGYASRHFACRRDVVAAVLDHPQPAVDIFAEPRIQDP